MQKQIIFKLKNTHLIPVEAENINPEMLKGKDPDQIRELLVFSGNREEKLGEYFDVEITELSGVPDSGLPRVIMHGDLTGFKRLGQGMAAGEMEINGSAGFHTGAGMKGGSLVIKGNAGDWLGAHMEGGLITVEGNAGHFVGAAYRGMTKAMTGGTILIKGNAGQMLGSRMRRGLIAVGGNCGDNLGFRMLAGTILVVGTTGIRIGANMIRGTIILLRQAELFPTFYENCTYSPSFWRVLLKELQQKGFSPKESWNDVLFKRFSGDAFTGLKGEVLICQKKLQ